MKMFTYLVSSDSIFVCLSMFIDSSLLCGLTLFKDVRRLVNFSLLSFLLEQLANFEDLGRLLWIHELFKIIEFYTYVYKGSNEGQRESKLKLLIFYLFNILNIFYSYTYFVRWEIIWKKWRIVVITFCFLLCCRCNISIKSLEFGISQKCLCIKIISCVHAHMKKQIW